MKKSVITDIFNGKRDFAAMRCKSEESEAAERKICAAHDALMKKLSPEQMALHEELVFSLEGAHIEEVDFFFAEGFKLGLLVGIEAAE